MIKPIRSQFNSSEEKKAYLDNLFYNVGMQEDFDLFFLDKETDKRSKWKKYSEVGFNTNDWRNNKFVEQANNRTILSREIVLDLEDPKRFKEVMEKLKKDDLYYRVFRTGSKGYHFHLIYDRKLTPEEKLEVIKDYNCDAQKTSRRCGIALEFCPHWKTGKPKELILENKGINKFIVKEKKEEMQEEEKNKPFFIEDFLIITFKDNGDVKSKKVNVDKFVEYLMNQYTFKTIYGSKTEEVFIFENGVYLKKGRAIIQTQTERILKEYATNHYLKEIEEKIKRLSEINKGEFDEIPEHLVCLNNGFLNLKTRNLEKHNPKYYFKTKLDVDYNKEADCKVVKKFFSETFYPDDLSFVQEWLGFNLYRKYFIKKAVICFGEKDTGKTIFLNLLMKFIGRKNTAGISLQRIASGDKFALSSLKDKYSNIFDDLSSKDLADQGGFKIATGGGFITAEHKFGDPFQFLNFAKHIFATNKIPSVKDVDDDAYYDRWIPLAFDNQVDKLEQDKFLIEKLTTNKEMSGLLNYALEGLKRIIENGKFSYNKDSKEIKRIMERHSDPLTAFAQDWLIERPGNKITKEQMFQIYSIYCKKNETAKLSKNQLGRRLGKKLNYVLDKRDKGRFWENVDINKNNIDLDVLDTTQKIICNELKKGKNNNLYIISEEVSNMSSNTGKPSEVKPKLLSSNLKKSTQEEIWGSEEWNKKQKELMEIQEKIESGEITNEQAKEMLKD